MLQPIALAICTLVSVVLLTSISRYRARMAKLDAIPTVGNRGFFSSYISAYKFVKNASTIMQEGYNRYPDSVFKVPLLDRWVVVISGTEMIKDIQNATDRQLSLRAAMQEMFHTKLIFGSSLLDKPYHIEVIRSTLTRSIGLKASDVYDEMVAAFNDEIPESTDWTKVHALHKVLNIVCRASNRLFVGLPLCRNEEWKALNIEFTRLVFTNTQTINLFPKFIQPVVGWYLNPRRVAFARASKHIRPIIVNRLEKFKELGYEWDAPATVNAKKEAVDVDDLIHRILMTNMAAIHTTNPIYSFHYSVLQRVSNSSPGGLFRIPLHDFTFSNGTVVPAGTLMMTCRQAIHFDDINYPNASEFDAFRSYREREKEGESLKHQMVTPEAGYLTFGAGKLACPGRFFAVNELKFLVSHTLLHYDIRFDEEDEKPRTNFFGARVVPDAKTKVMFRKRSV
ncbi:cytochrome p450 [Moniliophthora roreri]|nr:cytochrome p450 [Moniliophthora roreri]